MLYIFHLYICAGPDQHTCKPQGVCGGKGGKPRKGWKGGPNDNIEPLYLRTQRCCDSEKHNPQSEW